MCRPYFFFRLFNRIGKDFLRMTGKKVIYNSVYLVTHPCSNFFKPIRSSSIKYSEELFSDLFFLFNKKRSIFKSFDVICIMARHIKRFFMRKKKHTNFETAFVLLHCDSSYGFWMFSLVDIIYRKKNRNTLFIGIKNLNIILYQLGKTISDLWNYVIENFNFSTLFYRFTTSPQESCRGGNW